MRKYLNEKGLSLIELLATLSMMTIVGALVFGVLINSLHIFNRESDNSDVRQEANLISSQLTTFYKINGNFSAITDSDGMLSVTSTKTEDGVSSEESREYRLQDYNIEVKSGPDVDVVEGSYVHTDIEIIISEKKDDPNVFKLKSTISRLNEE